MELGVINLNKLVIDSIGYSPIRNYEENYEMIKNIEFKQVNDQITQFIHECDAFTLFFLLISVNFQNQSNCKSNENQIFSNSLRPLF